MLTRKAPTKRAPGDVQGNERRAPAGDNDTPETAPEDTRTPKPGEDE